MGKANGAPPALETGSSGLIPTPKFLKIDIKFRGWGVFRHATLV